MISEVGRTPVAKRWLTIHEASALLGVSTATLRRWADAGEITAFATPGGHRRFSRSAVLRLLPAGRRAGDTVGEVRGAADLADDGRELFREHGGRLATALLGIVGAATPEERESFVAAAESAAVECGRMAGRQGVGMAETVELFLRFRLPLLRGLMPTARRRRLDPTHATDPVETATEAIDHLLGALMRGHQAAVSESSPALPIAPTGSAPTADEVITP